MEVSPEPITSVTYIKGIEVDEQGNLYLIHSSGEVSSSTENAGSVIKFDGSGHEVLRIKHSWNGVDRVPHTTIYRVPVY